MRAIRTLASPAADSPTTAMSGTDPVLPSMLATGTAVSPLSPTTQQSLLRTNCLTQSLCRDAVTCDCRRCRHLVSDDKELRGSALRAASGRALRHS